MTENDHLTKLYPWLARVAFNMNRQHADDLKQIGAIAAWKALASFDGKSGSPEPWMKMHAINKMKTYLSVANGTRKDSKKPGWNIPVEDEHLDSVSIVMYHDLCYHYAEISAAVESLPEKQREYVYLRFWNDIPHSKLKDHFGYDPTGLWYSSARKTLKEKLAHLEGVA